MSLIYQSIIHRADLQANPDSLFVFGDNLQRKGLGGQAAAMRGEPNAVGLPTKLAPTPNGFLDDSYKHFLLITTTSRHDQIRLLQHILAGGTIIWPQAGIGTGLAQLASHAPSIHRYWKGFEILLRTISDSQGNTNYTSFGAN